MTGDDLSRHNWNGHDVARQAPPHDAFVQSTMSTAEELARTQLDEARQLVPLLVTGPLATPPYAGDCGLDLVTRDDAILPEGGWADILCGARVAMPPGTFGWVVGRSSTWVKWGIIVIPGIIDEGWRGDLYTMAYRPAGIRPRSEANLAVRHGLPTRVNPNVVPAGTRLAQLIVLPNLLRQIKIEQAGALPPSDRGDRGFGSSGT